MEILRWTLDITFSCWVLFVLQVHGAGSHSLSWRNTSLWIYFHWNVSLCCKYTFTLNVNCMTILHTKSMQTFKRIQIPAGQLDCVKEAMGSDGHEIHYVITEFLSFFFNCVEVGRMRRLVCQFVFFMSVDIDAMRSQWLTKSCFIHI